MFKRGLAIALLASSLATLPSSSYAQTRYVVKTLYAVIVGGIIYLETGSFAAAKEKQQEIPGARIEERRVKEKEVDEDSDDDESDDNN